MSFTFIDLFAGIGGFHAAMKAAGGECVYAVEIDKAAAEVYERNWNHSALGDITLDAGERGVTVPAHDVLCAGFPCQPFSKSGAQRGMEETRGTLYYNILKIIGKRKPAVVILENVRNLVGPRHQHEWMIIKETLRAKGYRVAEEEAIFSPHLLDPSEGGRPQVRERVFITATRIPSRTGFSKDSDPAVSNRPVRGWDPKTWDLLTDLPLEEEAVGCELTEAETLWIDAWDEFVQLMWEERQGRRLPGFPLWADAWRPLREVDFAGVPKWKADFLAKNATFYEGHRKAIDSWAARWDVYSDAFPASRRKLEWQAQDTPSLWDCVMHFRPSGVRAKAPTYLPALVAITQTSIIGPKRRRLSPREAARLQGLPDWFDFGTQSMAATYRQLGNGVSVGAVWHVLKSHVKRDEEIFKLTCPDLVKSVLDLPNSPDSLLEEMNF